MEYAIIYEWTGKNYSACAPDLPGCIACGDTMQKTEQLMREAISLYIEELKREGKPIPQPTTKVKPMFVDVV